MQISEKADDKMRLSLSMQSTDKRASVIFSDLLESLFESVAKTIEINQPLIETKYGMNHLCGSIIIRILLVARLNGHPRFDNIHLHIQC